MKKHDIMTCLINPGIIAIIRSHNAQGLLEAAEALYKAGITAVEISLTTPGALQAIEKIRTNLTGGCVIGAGTVLDAPTAAQAIHAGAQFTVSPVVKQEMITLCNRYGIPTLCGAYTPTEALHVHEYGGDFVKLFPANQLGPEYVKALLAPMPQLAIVPTGGVTVDNMAAYIKAGSVAVAVGTSVVNTSLIADKAWHDITERAARYVRAVKNIERRT
jgi:2-dehydro-3-deoxyphosphogluconate aldolase/(4S)-4-hydroxy-2-oxoglutarate aldolase